MVRQFAIAVPRVTVSPYLKKIKSNKISQYILGHNIQFPYIKDTGTLGKRTGTESWHELSPGHCEHDTR